MLKPRWRKVLRDLWLNRARTILVILSIAVGVLAIGIIGTSQIVLSTELDNAYESINPTSAWMMAMGAPFNKETLENIERMPEISATEGRRSALVRVKKGEDEWIVFQMNAIDDFEDIKVDKIKPMEGKWPPAAREMLIERSAMKLLDAEIGDTLTIKDPAGKIKEVTLVGTAQDVYALMYTMQNFGYGYVNFDTLEWFGQPREFNDLRFTVTDNKTDMEHIKSVTQLVQDKIERGGATLVYPVIPPPGQHPLNLVIQPTLALLGAFGLLSLVLSAFLIVNMISALLAQQQTQIGVMKAVGARPRQIVGLYFITVLILGALSLVIAIPLGILGAYGFTTVMANFLNLVIDEFWVPPSIIVVQVIVALLVPVMAAAYPILKGTRVTVREAISGYGLGKGSFGTSIFDRMLIRIRVGFLKRPTIISLRNTFRRKGRLMLTLLTLILAGSIFISVFSIQASLQSTVDMLLKYYNYDVTLMMERPTRIEKMVQVMADVEGVSIVEGWSFENVRRIRPDGTDSDNILVYAPPAHTQLVEPTLVEGRWLVPDDQNAVVVNTMILSNEPDVKVGDTLQMKLRGKEVEWTVVGIALGGGVTPAMFVNNEYLAKAMNENSKALYFFTQTTNHDPEFRKDVLKTLEGVMEANGLRVSAGITVDEDIAGIMMLFDILFALMLMMAIILAAVGGLGLMGTMSINVLERTREVGVMRAIGAANGAILQIVEVEGILIGVLSWLVSIFIAWPISKGLSEVIGQQLLSTDLHFTFSVAGSIIWLVLVIILSGLASFFPAWNAARLTVREVLAYE